MNKVYLVYYGVNGGEGFLLDVFKDKTKALNEASLLWPEIKNIEINTEDEILLNSENNEKLTRWVRVSTRELIS